MTLVDSKTYLKKDLFLYADEQEVFFNIQDLKLKNNAEYFVKVSGTTYLGNGESARNLLQEEYFLRGYFSFDKKNFSAVSKNFSIVYRII